MRSSGIAMVATLALFAVGCVKKPVPVVVPPTPIVQTAPRDIEHTIRFPGETLGVIAAWYTGKASNWEIIRDANPGVNPKKLRPGHVIRIPEGLATRHEPFGKEFVQKFFGGPSKKKETVVEPAPVEARSPDGGVAPSVDSTGEATPTPTPEVSPVAEAPATDTVVTPNVTVTTVVPAQVAEPEATPSATDTEREKLLDELLN